MNWWQSALLVLGVLWAVQIFGTWIQMRHYSDVMRGIAGEFRDGFLGTGNAKGGLGRGVIVMLVAGPDDRVRRALIMEGRTVLARFKDEESWRGLDMSRLADPAFHGTDGKSRADAFAKAIDQIKKLQAKGTQNAQGTVAADAGGASAQPGRG